MQEIKSNVAGHLHAGMGKNYFPGHNFMRITKAEAGVEWVNSEQEIEMWDRSLDLRCIQTRDGERKGRGQGGSSLKMVEQKFYGDI